MVTVAVLMPTSADLLTVRLLRDGSAVALRFASSSVHGQMRGSCVLRTRLLSAQQCHHGSTVSSTVTADQHQLSIVSAHGRSGHSVVLVPLVQ